MRTPKNYPEKVPKKPREKPRGIFETISKVIFREKNQKKFDLKNAWETSISPAKWALFVFSKNLTKKISENCIKIMLFFVSF